MARRLQHGARAGPVDRVSRPHRRSRPRGLLPAVRPVQLTGCALFRRISSRNPTRQAPGPRSNPATRTPSPGAHLRPSVWPLLGRSAAASSRQDGSARARVAGPAPTVPRTLAGAAGAGAAGIMVGVGAGAAGLAAGVGTGVAAVPAGVGAGAGSWRMKSRVQRATSLGVVSKMVATSRCFGRRCVFLVTIMNSKYLRVTCTRLKRARSFTTEVSWVGSAATASPQPRFPR